MSEAGARKAAATNTAEPRVDFRQLPVVVRWNRMFCAVALVPLVPSVIGMTIGGYWFVAPVGIGVYAAVVVAVRRTERIAIVSADDTLVVTNFLRTHRLQRREIASVRVDRTFGRRWSTFEICKQDGTGVFCDLMAGGPAMFRQSDVSIAMCRRAIEEWLRVGEL